MINQKHKLLVCTYVKLQFYITWRTFLQNLSFLWSTCSYTCHAVTHTFFPLDVHFSSDLSTEQLPLGLHGPTRHTPALFCHLKAPPSSQYDLGNSMKHIKPKSPAAAQSVCDSSVHYPYSSPAECCIQTTTPPLQRAPVDATRGYGEAGTSSTSPCFVPHGVHGVCVDPYMAAKPGLNSG